MNKRICECCGCLYATGKSYGDLWSQVSLMVGFNKDNYETKGLCEFCNPSSEWFSGCKCCNGRLKSEGVSVNYKIANKEYICPNE